MNETIQINGRNRIGATKQLLMWNFTSDELKDLKTKGWTSERIFEECNAWIERGLSKHESVKDDFKDQFSGLFYDTVDDDGDIFKSFGFYSVQDLTEEERKPPEFIIDGMIPVGMTFISGAPKIRKSFFALQMAIAVASGTTFFGHNTKKCEVAYFDLEGSKSRISARTEGKEIPKTLYIANKTTLKLADGLTEKIRALHHQKPDIRMCIIDTYGRARGKVKSGGANAYETDVDFLEPVQRMAIEENIAIVFVHHDSKYASLKADPFERLSGSMGISGSSDCVINMTVEGTRQDGKVSMEFTPRDARGGEMKLEFNPATLEWMQVVETPVDLSGNPVCRWIIDHVPERHKEGEFYPYEQIYRESYHVDIEKPGDKIAEQIKLHREQLFTEYNIGIQPGVQSHGRRGIRLISLL